MITSVDKQTLQDIYRQLVPMSACESAFTGMENLFYRTLQLARNYGSDQGENKLLKDLIEVKESVYSETQKQYSKSRQRELTIFHFKAAFKKKLALWIK
jgi:hypothetical protein